MGEKTPLGVIFGVIGAVLLIASIIYGIMADVALFDLLF